MKHLKRVCAGMVLTLALSLTTFAGQTPCGGIADPQPPETATIEDISAGVVEAAVSFLLSVF